MSTDVEKQKKLLSDLRLEQKTGVLSGIFEKFKGKMLTGEDFEVILRDIEEEYMVKIELDEVKPG